MVEVLNEQEQYDALKDWVKRYGWSIVLAICLAVAGLLGWQYYQTHGKTQVYQASILFDNAMMAEASGQSDALNAEVNQLMRNYASSPYAAMAALLQAKTFVVAKKYPEAVNALKWVVANGKFQPAVDIAKLRLARVYIFQGKAKLAVQLLGVSPKTYPASSYSILGDAYAAEGKAQLAKEAYAKSVSVSAKDDPLKGLVRMKQLNLTGGIVPNSASVATTKADKASDKESV